MKTESKATIWKIIKEYSTGLKGYKITFFLCFFFLIISYILNVIIPYFYKDFFNILGSSGDKAGLVDSLIRIILIIAGLNVTGLVLNRIGLFTTNHIEARGMAMIRQNSFNYLIKHSHGFFTNSFTGGLVQKVNRQARAFERLFDTLVFNLIPLLVMVIGAVIVTYFTSPVLSLVIVIWVGLYFLCSSIFYRWKMKYDIDVSKVDSETTGLLADNISNSQTISLFNGYQAEANSYKAATTKQANTMIKAWDFSVVYDSLNYLWICLAEFFIFYYAIKFWQVDKLTVGGIVMVQIYVVSLAKQIWSINQILRNIFESLADSKEMVEIMLTPHEIKDSNIATNLRVSKGEIELKNITFNFNETRTVLDNVNCLIKPGEKVALIGPSGAGKTTFVRLILRLYNLTSGHVLVDKQDISLVTQDSLRENISLVPQDPVLFHRSLMENIRYGRREATDDEVKEAARLAHCDEFIDVLPLKYETFVGERGIKLSGGERQRVAIARAILKKAPILILDEATSSLDSHSEKLIQDALDNLMKGCTTIAIAHRLSTIRKMDRIIVMKNGKIIEEGTHDELSNKDSGLYKDLWELQAGGFIEK